MLNESRELYRNGKWILLLCSSFLLAASAASSNRNLLLICPPDWQSSLTEYIAQRRSQGWQVHLLTPEAPRFENIHHQICCFFWKNKLFQGHLFLIGDYSRIPGASRPFPSDLPYCFMDGPGDSIPEWICSRLPASSAGEVREYLAGLPENGRIPSKEFFIDLNSSFCPTEIGNQSPFLPKSGFCSAQIQFSENIAPALRRVFQEEWQINTCLFPDYSLGEAFHLSCLGLYSRLPRHQTDLLIHNMHFFGDPSLSLSSAPNPSPPPAISIRRSMDFRLPDNCRETTVSIRFRTMEPSGTFILIREQLPWSWEVQSVLWNQQQIQYVQDENTLKILIQTDGSPDNTLKYSVRINGYPGELYTIRGNFLLDEVLYSIQGLSVLSLYQKRHVIETTLNPGWNLLCFSAWLSPEEQQADSEAQFLQNDRSARCWIQCSPASLQPEMGFWLFHPSPQTTTKEWLADGIPATFLPPPSGWHLSNPASCSGIHWLWKHNQYRKNSLEHTGNHAVWQQSSELLTD